MLKLFKGIYAIFLCVRECIINLFFILFLLTGFASIAFLVNRSDTNKSKEPNEKVALRLNLSGYSTDNHDDFAHRLIQSELTNDESLKASTFDVVRAIGKAAKDPNITGIVLDLSKFEGSDHSSLSFIGSELKAFKTSGKPVIAIGENYSQSQYYLASFADKIYLNKAGSINLQGLNFSSLYFKALLDKIDAVPHIFRVGTYKSAVEPFLRNDMSDEAKQNAQTLLNSIWHQFRTDIAENRMIAVDQVLPEPKSLIEKYKAVNANDAQYALNQKLVTDIGSKAEIEQALIEQFGKNEKGIYQHINYADYALNLTDRFAVNAEHKIAVINVEGEIISGKSKERSAGSETISELLRQAREDNNVDGVILRVNSPGGSVVASEIILQELQSIQQAGKPVVTSMGGLAASGGYWISATSDKIIASPNTITGSIGIFGLAMTFEKTAKHLGISEDGVATSPLAKTSSLQHLSNEHAELIQINIENGYDAFLDLVSRGRNMSKAEVDKVAQGQVWSGEDALKHGLVDQLGDFHTAYDVLTDLINQKRKAKGENEIKHFTAQWFIESDKGLFSSLLKNIGFKAKSTLAVWLGLPFVPQTQQAAELLQKFNDPQNTYLYCLTCGTIK